MTSDAKTLAGRRVSYYDTEEVQSHRDIRDEGRRTFFTMLCGWKAGRFDVRVDLWFMYTSALMSRSMYSIDTARVHSVGPCMSDLCQMDVSKWSTDKARTMNSSVIAENSIECSSLGLRTGRVTDARVRLEDGHQRPKCVGRPEGEGESISYQALG